MYCGSGTRPSKAAPIGEGGINLLYVLTPELLAGGKV